MLFHNCPFCNLKTETFDNKFISYCFNHKVETIFYELTNSICFVMDDYYLYIDDSYIILYIKFSEGKNITLPLISSNLLITPETAESVVEKILSLKAFL